MADRLLPIALLLLTFGCRRPAPPAPLQPAPSALAGTPVSFYAWGPTGSRGEPEKVAQWYRRFVARVYHALRDVGLVVVALDEPRRELDVSLRADGLRLGLHLDRVSLSLQVDSPRGDRITTIRLNHDHEYDPDSAAEQLAHLLVNALTTNLAGGAPAPAPLPASAEPPPPPVVGTPAGITSGARDPDAYAVAFGVEHHRDGFQSATGAHRDAKRFQYVAEQSLGVSPEHVRIALFDDARRARMQAHLAWLARAVPAGGRAYIYFAGHGVVDADGRRLLVPYDGDPTDVDTCLALADIVRFMEDSEAGHTLLFVDAGFGTSGARAASPPDAPPPRLPIGGDRIALLLATTGAEPAHVDPEDEEGLFTRFVSSTSSAGSDRAGPGITNFDPTIVPANGNPQAPTWNIGTIGRMQSSADTPMLSTSACPYVCRTVERWLYSAPLGFPVVPDV